MPNVRRFVATSKHPLARAGRKAYWGVQSLTLPAPKVIVKPMLYAFLAARTIYYFLMRVLVCEPLFKAYCSKCGRGVRTDVHVHYVQGKGNLVVGDFVEVDGKCNFIFATRFSDQPTLEIGDHSIVRHGSSFVVSKGIKIGKHCKISSWVSMFDSNGHPADPEERQANLPPRDEDVRPITIGDNVWIGTRAIISPGVTIGEGSIVSAASVVVSDVPPYTMVAGFPARKVTSLRNPSAPASAPSGPQPVRIPRGAEA